MKLKVGYMLFLFGSIIPVAHADNQAEGMVKGFYVNEAGQALLKLNVENPECGSQGTGGWDYFFNSTSNLHGNQWTSMLIAARMSSSTIKIGYKPTSSPGQNCQLSFVYFYDA